MSYTRDRDQFIAEATRHGLPLDDARALLRAATTLNRYAELACSSEAAERDRVSCPMERHHLNTKTKKQPCLCDGDHDAGRRAVPRIAVLEAQVIRRLEHRIAAVNTDLARRPAGIVAEGAGEWRIVTAGDPRGLRAARRPASVRRGKQDRPNHDPRSIGVPSGPSGLKW